MNKQLLMLTLLGGFVGSAVAVKEVVTEAEKKPVVTTTVPLEEANKLRAEKAKKLQPQTKTAETVTTVGKGNKTKTHKKASTQRAFKSAPEEASKKGAFKKEVDERLKKIEDKLEQVIADHKRLESKVVKTNGKKSAE